MKTIDVRVLEWRTLSAEPGVIDTRLYRVFPTLASMHGHDFAEFFFIVEGRMVHCLWDGTEEVVGPGDLVFIRPSDVHGFRREGRETCFMINVAFSAAFLEELWGFLAVEASRRREVMEQAYPPRRRLREEARQQVSTRLIEAATGLQQPVQPTMRALLAQWLAGCCLPETDRAPSLPSWLGELCVQMHHRENFIEGVPRLQELAGRTAEHVSRSFRKHLGTTPSGYVNDQRLHYASNLLQMTDASILDVALEAGFGSLSYFNRLFRRKYGVRPREYRRQAARVLI